MLHLAGNADERPLAIRHRRPIEHLDKMRHQALAERRAGREQFAQILYVAPGERVADDADADRAHDRPGRLMPKLRIHDLAQRHDLTDVSHAFLPP